MRGLALYYRYMTALNPGICRCTSIAVAIAPEGAKDPENWWGQTSVSQALNVLYHAPARV